MIVRERVRRGPHMTRTKSRASKPKLLKGKALKRPFLTTFAATLPAMAAAVTPAGSATQPPLEQGAQNGPSNLPFVTGPCQGDETRACHKTIGQHQGYVDCFAG